MLDREFLFSAKVLRTLLSQVCIYPILEEKKTNNDRMQTTTATSASNNF